MDDVDLPGSAATLAKKLEGWSHKVVGGTGERTVKVRGLDAHGRTALIESTVDVEWVFIRAGHVDTRWFVACWVKVGDDRWKFDGAWRRWHGHDWPVGLPVALKAREVHAYATADSVDHALVAIAGLRGALAA